MNNIIYKNFLKKKFYFVEDDVIKNYNFKIDLVFNWMKKLNLKSPNILDIGANNGIYSIYYAKKYKNSKIFSFEPVKKNYFLLKKNIHLNKIKNIKTYNFGFFNKNKTAKIGLPDKREIKKNINNGFYSIFGENSSKKIRLKTIDKFVKKNKIKKIDFIKIDTEGSEYFILKGGLKTIEKFKPIIQFEYNFITKKLGKKRLKDILKIFIKLNYKKYYLVRNDKILPKIKKKQFFSDIVLIP